MGCVYTEDKYQHASLTQQRGQRSTEGPAKSNINEQNCVVMTIWPQKISLTDTPLNKAQEVAISKFECALTL